MCSNCGRELIDNRCSNCDYSTKKTGLNFKIIVSLFLVFFVVASTIVGYNLINKKEEPKIIENNDQEEDPLIIDKEYYFDGFKINLLDNYRIHSQRIIKKDNIYILFHESKNLPVKELNLVKEDLIKTFKDEGVELKNLGLKKLNDVEFIYSEAKEQNTEVLFLYFNSDSNNSISVVVYDMVTKKQPGTEIIYDLTEMFKTIERKEF